MKKPQQQKPETQSPAEQARTAREAAALRANLTQRKDQARQRENAQPMRDAFVPPAGS
jgi:hypothetical protein